MFRLLVLLILLTGCYAEEVQQDMEREPFFDLAGYMQAQIDSLTTLQPAVRKTVILNGAEETKELADLRFATDLRMFREADINKPAWLDKYTVTNESGGGGAQVQRYVATDSSMQTRQLDVTLSNAGTPVRIVVYRKTGTVLSDGDHVLMYDPTMGYDIRTKQTNRFGEDLDATITVRWQ